MSEQYPGGFITKVPPTPSGPYEDSAAPGLWTMSQAAAYKKQGLWPTAGNFPLDAQFNYVTMLLHGDGTNGAQNNTFLDSSTNNFTITRNGNTTQGSFSPYGSNWGNYFGAANGNALLFTEFTLSSDFTIETWVYPTAQSSSGYTIVFSASSSAEQIMYYYTDGRVGCYFANGANGISSTGKLSMNVWSHVAVVRSGSTVKIYVNGVDTGVSISGTATVTVGTISGYTTGSGYNVYGYLSNARVGTTAVYTSGFTPPTAPLTAITGTVLLTCQSNRFIDNSTSARTITLVGTPSVQRFNPFGTATAYDTSVIGGSGYFDGSGDYVQTPDNSAFNISSGDFTMEAWVYYTSRPTSNVMSINSGSGVSGIYYMHGSSPAVYITSNGSSWDIMSQNVSSYLPLNCWNHTALVRNGNTWTIYINGVSVYSTTNSSSISINTTVLSIGASGGGGQPTFGYISDARLVKGTAVYTGSTYTVPTAPLTAITNTSVLVGFKNGAIYDNAMMNDLETVGNAQISTSVKKYGTGSLAFDGTSNCCLTTQSAMSSSGPFTFECWAYWNDTGTSSDMGMLCSQYASGESGRMLFGSQSGALVLRVDGGTVYLTTSVSTGTWYFVAWTFDGTTHRLFLDGTLASSSTSVPALYTGVNTSIGGQPDALLTDYCLDGYMDEVRITKGVARYTTTFTPPTAAFENTGPN